MSVVSEHRYPRGAIWADYSRATAGIVATTAPLIFAQLGVIASTVLAVLATSFVFFAVRAGAKQRLVVTCSESKLTIYRIKTNNLDWRALHTLDLRYYAVNRDRTRGWMQLTLGGDGAVFRLESSLDGFDVLARKATDAALENGVTLSPTTVVNLQSLDIKVVTPEAPAGAA
jgi:hypothetical protein